MARRPAAPPGGAAYGDGVASPGTVSFVIFRSAFGFGMRLLWWMVVCVLWWCCRVLTTLVTARDCRVRRPPSTSRSGPPTCSPCFSHSAAAAAAVPERRSSFSAARRLFGGLHVVQHANVSWWRPIRSAACLGDGGDPLHSGKSLEIRFV